jgi:trigger factor
MEYKIKEKNKSEKEIEVTVSIEEVEDNLEKAAEILSKEKEIKGFRPGKAPVNIVKEVFGEERLWHEACHQAINKKYIEIAKKEDLEIISYPKIDILKIENKKPLIFKAIVTTMPEIKLSNYKESVKKINKEKITVEATEEEVTKAIDVIRSSRAKIAKTSRAAKNGDQVLVDFEGKIDGINQKDFKKESFPIIIGDGKFIKEFEEKIIGMKEEEESSFKIKLPSYDNSEKEVEFKVKVISVNEREVPNEDDSFAKSLGNFSGIKELRAKIKENLLEEKMNKEKEKKKIKIIDLIIKGSSADIPDILIQKESENMLREFKNQFLQMGASFEEYLKKNNKNEEELKKDWKDQAEKRVMTILALQKISKNEKILASDKEIEEETKIYLNRVHDKSSLKESDIKNIELYIKDLIQNNKVFDFLESL